jgi:hypothetical protein
MSHVSEQLMGDHAAVDRVLKQLQAALRDGNIELAHTKLDLFWARLAVHIRAEHLHLFPTVSRAVENAESSHESVPSPDEAQTLVAQLRQDHDFFMHQLPLAVEIMRELMTLPEQVVVPEGLNNVANIIYEVEQRLVKHNELEETQIYRWATILLNSEEQAKLSHQIATELRKRPSRFTLSAWLDK